MLADLGLCSEPLLEHELQWRARPWLPARFVGAARVDQMTPDSSCTARLLADADESLVEARLAAHRTNPNSSVSLAEMKARVRSRRKS